MTKTEKMKKPRRSGSKVSKAKTRNTKNPGGKTPCKQVDLGKKSRRWAFTINNYTKDDIKIVKSLDADYCIYGYEVGDNGTPHIQGYCQYKSTSRRLGEMKKRLPRAHLEVALGSPEQNIEYCKGYHGGKLKAEEENEYHEKGDPPAQGKRSDLESVKDDLKTKPMCEVVDNHFNTFLKYGRMMKEYRLIMQKHRTEPPIVEWVYGPTGIGKSRYAYTKSDSVYIKDQTPWWDLYDQEDVIVIDDFDGKWPFRDLLRLLDRYPYQGQIKGGYVKINSKYIIITCDRTMEDVYDGILSEHEMSQLKRRISIVKQIKGVEKDSVKPDVKKVKEKKPRDELDF